MKRILSCMLLIIGWFSGSIADAACTSKSCADERVERIYLSGTGEVFVDLSGDTSNLNCSLVSGVYLTLKPNHANKQEIYSLLLATQSASKPLANVRIIENSSDCEISYVYQDEQTSTQ